MKASTQSQSYSSKSKSSTKSRRKATIFSCPTDAIGWCPYPFSPAQLRRHLKKLTQVEQAKHPVTSAAKS